MRGGLPGRRPHSPAAAASAVVAGVAAALVLAAPAPAYAHGVQGRAETPVPLGVFFVTAGVVVVVSFLGLAVGWSRPRFAEVPWRAAPERLSRLVLHPALTAVLRVLVLAGLVAVLATAAFGSELLNRNFAPLTVFVVWWVGLVPLSLLFGDVWRQVNPWATLARAVPARLRGRSAYPPGLGLWPAAFLMAVWAWLELVYPTAASPRLLAGLVVAYSVLTVAAMCRYGIDQWLDHGETFAVFTRFVSTVSAAEVRDTPAGRRLGFRPPVVAATRIAAQPGLVAFVSVLIGTVTFDGLSGTALWAARDVAATERVITLGVEPFTAGLVIATIGLLIMIGLAAGAFEAASWAADRAAGLSRSLRRGRVADALAPSLIPIAVGYAIAHYFTLFVFQSQDLVRLASDPFGTGADWFGTAGHAIDFTVVSPNTIWAVQVGAIVIAHVLGLVLAHDRTLELTPRHAAGRSAVYAARSQTPMLMLMVVLTVGGLYFLSEGMNDAV